MPRKTASKDYFFRGRFTGPQIQVVKCRTFIVSKRGLGGVHRLGELEWVAGEGHHPLLTSSSGRRQSPARSGPEITV
jgi:hypothetical protein